MTTSSLSVVSFLFFALAIVAGCGEQAPVEPPTCQICNYEGGRVLSAQLNLDINAALGLLDQLDVGTDRPVADILGAYKELCAKADEHLHAASETAAELHTYYARTGRTVGLARLRVYELYIEALSYKSALLAQRLDDRHAEAGLESACGDAAVTVAYLRDELPSSWGEAERTASVSLLSFCLKLCLEAPMEVYGGRDDCIDNLDKEIERVLGVQGSDAPVFHKIEGVVYRAGLGVLAQGGETPQSDIVFRCETLRENVAVIEASAASEANATGVGGATRWRTLAEQAKAATEICVSYLSREDAVSDTDRTDERDPEESSEDPG